MQSTEMGRFVKLPRRLLCRGDLSLAAKVVLAVIADRAGVNGRAWPSIRSIAQDTAISPATVKRALGALRRLGLVRTESRGVGRSLAYCVADLGQNDLGQNDLGQNECRRAGKPGRVRAGENRPC